MKPQPAMRKNYSLPNNKTGIFADPKQRDTRRGVRVVEGARLESVYTGNCIAGSNPALSADFKDADSASLLFFGVALPYYMMIEFLHCYP